jgi:hypothetical protein
MSSIVEWLEGLGTWAWERHHNVLSWYVRPLFLLPFSYFAYRRSLTGITLTLVALATSMAWFPAPEQPDPAVVDMLRAERDYLLGEWTAAKVAMTLLVPLMFTAMALALWRRSIGWALVVVNAGVLSKIALTFWMGSTSGAIAHLVPALTGLAIVDAVVVAVHRWYARRHQTERTTTTPEKVS